MVQTFNKTLQTLEADLADIFNILSWSVVNRLRRWADSEGIVPIYAINSVQLEAGALVTNMFMGDNWQAKNAKAPYIIIQDGALFPLSPYMRILWKAITDGTTQAVQEQADIINKNYVHTPHIQEQTLLTRLNPFIAYDPPHLWVDPGGYQLSERVWRTAGQTRRRVDFVLEQGIRQGKSVDALAKDLEKFLQPGRVLDGAGDASYDAMRLARTETARAHAQASETIATLNPFIEMISVVLSPAHPRYDICDVAAAASPFPKNDIPASYKIPLHPNCLCSYRYTYYEDKREAQDKARREGRTQYWGEFIVNSLIKALLTGVVANKLRGILND